MTAPNSIALTGVRVHNLQRINVSIPLGGLTVVTGVSGAGKRSLVFDTLYAEAQRRYLQSFSTYTRQFLERFDKPDADTIGDLPPAVAIRRAGVMSPLVMVGSLTDVGEALRLLFARLAEFICPGCGSRVTSHAIGDVIAHVQALPTGTRCAIGFRSAPADTSDRAGWQAGLLEEGFVRIQVGSQVHRLDDGPIPPIVPPDVGWVLIDRLEVGKATLERITESAETAFRRGEGRLAVLADQHTREFDRRYCCIACNRFFPVPSARLFDAGDPLGACPECDGAGLCKPGKSATPCPACDGARFNADARAGHVAGRSIVDWLALPVVALAETLNRLDANLEPLRLAVDTQLCAMRQLGLSELCLGQRAQDMSDGSLRRLMLAGALASYMVNVLYVIDEPTMGLHPTQHDCVRDALLALRDRGNTVVVIEHERGIITAADHVIDLGPGTAEEGGTVTYHGPPSGLAQAEPSPTIDWWTGRTHIETPRHRRKSASTIGLPLGVLCVVAGVDESARRRWVDTLAKAKPPKGITDVVLLDQSPLARGARSNPATYLKVFDDIRALFSEAVDAKIRNFGPGHFSFNQPGGRCGTCEGQGSLTIDMQFLADVTTVCPDCQGRRYRREILDIKVRSRSIAAVLDLSIREAFRFFRAQAKIEKKLKVLLDVGLDYLRLGQSVETLSGSECQRLKLANHLATSRKGGCLFVLLDPSAGLHAVDVADLLGCFDRLLSAGHSLVVLDNDEAILRSADWIVEPEADSVRTGTPEQLMQQIESSTGRWLAEIV
ncbi:MAG: hypothetical protein EXS16_03545 [Gemmataceae bacterium]|nr:hypothetical protein [Gemmataceae bacterium]